MIFCCWYVACSVVAVVFVGVCVAGILKNSCFDSNLFVLESVGQIKIITITRMLIKIITITTMLIKIMTGK